MCVEEIQESLRPGACFFTKDDSEVIITNRPERGPIQAVVYQSQNPSHPVGHVFEYQSAMGHVLCEGSDEKEQDKCTLHPLDAKRETSMNEEDCLRLARAFVDLKASIAVPNA